MLFSHSVDPSRRVTSTNWHPLRVLQRLSYVVWLGSLLMAGSFNTASANELLNAYHKALQYDPNYAAARAIFEAEAKSNDLAAAAFMPTVNLTLSSDQTNYERRELAARAVQVNDYQSTGLVLRVTQPLFSMDRLGYKRENEIRAVQAEWVLAQARQDLVLRLLQTSFNYLLSLDQITQAQAQAQALQAQLQQLEGLLGSRIVTRTEVADARARHELAQVLIRTTQSQLEVHKLEFMKLTGELPSQALQTLRGNPDLTAPMPSNPQQWIDAAKEGGLKVMAQRAALALAEASLERSKAGYYPSVSLVATRQQGDHPNYFTKFERNDTVSFQLSMNLFDGGNTTTLKDQARARADRARSELAATQHDLAIEAGQAYWGVINGIEQVKAVEKAVAAAEIALEGTRLGIKANVKTYADELNSVQLLYSSRRDLQKERYTYLINRVQLLLATGTTEESIEQLLLNLMP